MQKILIVFFIVFLFLLILVFPFKTRVMAHVNLMELKCYYSLKTWIIKLLCGKIEVKDGKFVVNNENTLFLKTYKNNFVKTMTKQILNKIDIKKVELFFKGGFSDNSFSSAIVCGFVESIFETAYAYLSLKYDDIKMYKDVDPTFYNNNLELTGDIVVSISFWKIIKCLFLAIGEVKKNRSKYERKKLYKQN